VVPKDAKRPEPVMSVPDSVAEILAKHVTLEVEGIDRMYINAYVRLLQAEGGVVLFFRRRGYAFASSSLMHEVSKRFIAAIEAFVEEHNIPLLTFEKGRRKDDIGREHLARFRADEGVLFVGKAQEKTRVLRTEKRRNPKTGESYAWLVRSTAMVNHYYFYAVDRDFGPFFLKFSSYFPYTAKLCINGHEYVKRQLAKKGIVFEPLDNGILSCAEPKRLQTICDELSGEKIDAFFRKWLRLLPHPFTGADRRAGYRYDLSILQAEFSLTQVLDRPLTGRIFFEEVIRENLDIGRPSQVQLIFDRRVIRTTPGRFRTRIITEGVTASLHVDYKSAHIKQYHKEGRALRTETTINHAPDFGVGKRLKNLPDLRKIGFQANRRLLNVESISHDCALGEDAFHQIDKPVLVDGQRIAALRFSDPHVQALLSVLVLFCLLPRGFSNRDLREHLAPMLGIAPSSMNPGRMSYDLRRLRHHAIVERIPKSHRYRLTSFGLRAALFFTRVYNRVLRPGLSQITPVAPAASPTLKASFDRLEKAVAKCCREAKLAA
jgi:hypothetical protein